MRMREDLGILDWLDEQLDSADALIDPMPIMSNVRSTIEAPPKPVHEHRRLEEAPGRMNSGLAIQRLKGGKARIPNSPKPDPASVSAAAVPEYLFRALQRRFGPRPE